VPAKVKRASFAAEFKTGIDSDSEERFNRWIRDLAERLETGEVTGDEPEYDEWDPDADEDEDEPDSGKDTTAKMSAVTISSGATLWKR
jgi:hypothetical protein